MEPSQAGTMLPPVVIIFMVSKAAALFPVSKGLGGSGLYCSAFILAEKLRLPTRIQPGFTLAVPSLSPRGREIIYKMKTTFVV